MEDKYYKKYLKYKKKYLELKYGSGILHKLSAINIVDVIPPTLSRELYVNIEKYIDEFVNELSKNNTANIKKYINDIQKAIPLFKDIGGLFIKNISIFNEQFDYINNIDINNIDVNKIKEQIKIIKDNISKLEFEKKINTITIAPKLLTIMPSLMSNFNMLKETELFKKLGIEKIIQPLANKISPIKKLLQTKN